MAINKLTRTDDNGAEFRNQLITALTPYFTSVSYNETDKKIICTETVGDTEKTFLTLNMGGTTTFVPTIVYYLDGSNQSVDYYQTSSSVVGKIKEFYTCTNGLALSVGNTGITYPLIFGITKDNNGNTVIITPNDSNTSPSLASAESFPYQTLTKNSVYSNDSKRGLMLQRAGVNKYNCYPSTTLANLPVNDVGAYCPNAYMFLAKEQSIIDLNIRKINIDGVNYLAAAFWCIKDV